MPKRKRTVKPFKTCDCGKTWRSRGIFLLDKSVKIIGYQPDFINRKYNHFLFQHKTKNCGAFLAVRASDFADLREKSCSPELCAGHENCPGYCLNTLDLRVCSVTCRNATDRAVAAKLANRRILRKLFPLIAANGELRGKVKKDATGRRL